MSLWGVFGTQLPLNAPTVSCKNNNNIVFLVKLEIGDVHA